MFHRAEASSSIQISSGPTPSARGHLSYDGPSPLISPAVDEKKRLEDQGSYAIPVFDNALPPSSTSNAYLFLVWQLIAQTLLATGILVFFLAYVDQRAFNVVERRPHYQLANGTHARVSHHDWLPLQSDITTIISVAFNLLGKLYSGWIAIVTWNYAFLLLEKNGLRLETLSSMLALPLIPALFPPPGTEADPSQVVRPQPRGRRTAPYVILFVLLSAFPASFSPPIATGSISWHASTRNISNADIIHDISSQGANYGDSNPWSSFVTDMTFRPRYIQRAIALTTHAWTSVGNSSSSDALASRRVVPSVQTLAVGSSLNNVTIPMFTIESFEWITDGSDVSADQLAYLTPKSTPGVLYSPVAGQNPTNPLQSTPGVIALLPDMPYANKTPFFSSGNNFPDPFMVKSKSGVVAVAVNYAGSCNASTTIALFGVLPTNAFTAYADNVWGYNMCFVFAKLTYSAGAATCNGCEVVFPLVVQPPSGVELTLQRDVATEQALYVMADVIGELASANVTMPLLWNNIEAYTKEVLVRGYSSAWTVMSELFAFYHRQPSTYVSIPITMSRAFVNHHRVWAWYANQVLAFVGGFMFIVHIRVAARYPISNPLLHGFMLDVRMSEENRQMIARGRIDTWSEDFRDTFVSWDRGTTDSALMIHGPLRATSKSLPRRVIGCGMV